MNKLIRYELEFEPALVHVKDNLDEINTLSKAILNMIDLRCGSFFTLLPKEANLQQLYQFKSGGILPQNPIEENWVNGRQSWFSWIPDIELELSYLMYNEIIAQDHLSWVFDDFNAQLDKNANYDLFINYGLQIDKEAYYFLDKNKISPTNIQKCLKQSNVLWHSLCFLTAANLITIPKQLSDIYIEEICAKIELFMVWAYDSEGYVFWEKEGCHFFKSCDNK